MKLVTFADGQRVGIGLLDHEGQVRDLAVDPGLPIEMTAFIAAWPLIAERVAAAGGRAPVVPDAVLRAPVVPPSNVICVGKNYREHVREFSASGYDTTQVDAFPPYPVIFTKSRTSVSGPGDPVPVSLDDTGTSDYEGELAVVIGEGGFRIAKADAMAHVFGYTIVNDLTIRELQRRHGQFFLAKSFRGYCPIGPAILTADEVPDVAALEVRTRVNGEQRQHGVVADLNFSIPDIIETVSSVVELRPGDVIATGTPGGVAVGFTPPKYLRPGDRLEVEVQPIGVLANVCE